MYEVGRYSTYINGYAFKPSDWGNTGLPIIRIQDLTGSSYQMNYYNGDYPSKIEIHDGDVLISWSASLGVYIWNGGKALLNQHIFKVIFDKITINKQYFVYAVRYNLDAMISKMHGATMKHIVKKDFDNIEILYPSDEKQNEIVNILTKLENIIDLHKQQLKDLEDLIKSRFVEMFGDPDINTLGLEKDYVEKHIDLLTGYPFKSEQYAEKGVNICGGLIIMPQRIQWENCLHWKSVDGFEEYMLHAEDIVMALDRPWISEGFKIAKVDAEHLPALLIQRTARIRAVDINQDYLYYCFILGGFD